MNFHCEAPPHTSRALCPGHELPLVVSGAGASAVGVGCFPQFRVFDSLPNSSALAVALMPYGGGIIYFFVDCPSYPDFFQEISDSGVAIYAQFTDCRPGVQFTRSCV